MIDDIIVGGGGNAGYVSALILHSSFPKKNIKIIQSEDIGITSPDTGNDIIKAIRIKDYKSINFKARLAHQLHSINASSFHYDMAREFELYFYEDTPFMSHMFGWCFTSFYH